MAITEQNAERLTKLLSQVDCGQSLDQMTVALRKIAEAMKRESINGRDVKIVDIDYKPETIVVQAAAPPPPDMQEILAEEAAAIMAAAQREASAIKQRQMREADEYVALAHARVESILKAARLEASRIRSPGSPPPEIDAPLRSRGPQKAAGYVGTPPPEFTMPPRRRRP